MNLETNLYEIGSEDHNLEEILDELKIDFASLSELLDVEDYYESIDTDNYIADLEDYKFLELLPEKVIKKINDFTKNIFNREFEISYKPNENTLRKLLKIHNLLSEQLMYSYPEIDNNCTVWLVVSKINGFIYGATCVFYNPEVSKNIFMQGISRTFIPSLLEILIPGVLKTLPRLNNLLQPVVESIGKSMKAQKIYVAPIGNQGDILVKHYGYVSDKNIKFPCDMIRGKDMISNNPGYFETYSKTITYESTEM